jgi:hypothetical protein
MGTLVTAALRCHPTTPTTAVDGVHVDVARTAAGVLVLRFALVGDLGRLRIPAPEPARVAHDLWRHTCFEAFVGAEGSPGYHELDVSPSGAWGLFAFRRYRDGGPVGDATLAPGIAVAAAPARLALDVHLRLDRLSPAHVGAPIRLGLAAVVEETSGTLTYWALRHPPGAPDFHREETFALGLEAGVGSC